MTQDTQTMGEQVKAAIAAYCEGGLQPPNPVAMLRAIAAASSARAFGVSEEEIARVIDPDNWTPFAMSMTDTHQNWAFGRRQSLIKARTVLSLLNSASTPAQVTVPDGWRPIETAPKNGAKVDLWIVCINPAWRPEGEEDRACDCWWSADENDWLKYSDLFDRAIPAVANDNYRATHYIIVGSPAAPPRNGAAG